MNVKPSSFSAGPILVLLTICAVGAYLLLPPWTRSPIRQIDGTSPANHYLSEFKEYRTRPGDHSVSPDGLTKIEDRRSGDMGACHALWLSSGSGSPKLALIAREADPGSGLSFSWGWSKDSKALFISGTHSGIDCYGPDGYSMRLIHTLVDNTTWDVKTAL